MRPLGRPAFCPLPLRPTARRSFTTLETRPRSLDACESVVELTEILNDP